MEYTDAKGTSETGFNTIGAGVSGKRPSGPAVRNWTGSYFPVVITRHRPETRFVLRTHNLYEDNLLGLLKPRPSGLFLSFCVLRKHLPLFFPHFERESTSFLRYSKSILSEMCNKSNLVKTVTELLRFNINYDSCRKILPGQSVDTMMVTRQVYWTG